MTPASTLASKEETRLRSLQQQEVLDAYCEPIFMALVDLMATALQLPISLLSVTDDAETIFIANSGLAGLVRLPYNEAMCSVVARQGRVLVLPDLQQPLPPALPQQAVETMQAKGMRFYAGAPLRMPDSQSIGTLCVMDPLPHLVAASEQAALEQLAALVAHVIDVRRHCLADRVGHKHWQQAQYALVEEVSALTRRAQTLGASSAQALQLVVAGLQGVETLLDDYQCVSA